MKKNKFVFVVLFLFSILSYSQNSCEDNVIKANELLSEKSPFTDGKTIFNLVNSCADEGSTEAESIVGLLYLNGIGTEVNNDLAFKFISSAANKGFANAQYNLGRMYKYGVGCDLNFETAMDWFEIATENGNQRAAYSLGYMYFKGFAIPQDYAKAVAWFEQSDDYMAQHYLGLSYYLGYGVVPNEDKALEILLTNPISNSEALVNYIQNNKKEIIEAGVNEVIETNDTEVDHNLNLETTATSEFSSSELETVTKEEIQGDWEGKFIQYDWSGTTIVRIIPIEFSLNNTEDAVAVTSFFENEHLNSDAVWQDSSLYFEDDFNFSLEKLYAQDLNRLFLDYRLLSLDFKKYVLFDQTYLIADSETYIDDWKEFGRPSRIILKQKGNNTDINEEMILALASQKDQFIKLYPVPFKENLVIQYQLEIEGNVYVELVSVNGGSPIVVKPNELQQPGDYIYTVPINYNLPFGLYAVRLIAGNQLYTRVVVREK